MPDDLISIDKISVPALLLYKMKGVAAGEGTKSCGTCHSWLSRGLTCAWRACNSASLLFMRL